MHEYTYYYVCDPWKSHVSSENLTQTSKIWLTTC